ncbi:dipeptidase [Spirosoma arcticum]
MIYVSEKREKTEHLHSEERFVRQLRQLIAFPSISTDKRYAGAVKDCATWLAEHLKRIGLRNVTLFPTQLHPVVYAERVENPRLPTLLIYGHYDVQPVEPLNAWTVPPFEGVIKGNKLYGRGASDDKGQFFAHLKAIEQILDTHKKLPINVKVLLEGEEEIGSPNLAKFINAHRQLLRADWAVLSDTNMISAEQPSLTYALRGSLSVEIEVKGPKAELHSGNFGGAVYNPLQALCELVANLHDHSGRITIPGFYDAVKAVSPRERQYLRQRATSNAQLMQEAKIRMGWGEMGYSLYERTTIRPSLSINGLMGGYQGEGVKSVIPPTANAKLNFRLVPNQNPYQIEALLKRYIRALTPPQVKTNVTAQLHAMPYTVPPGHPVLNAAKRAYREGFGKSAVLQRSGGTIPVVSLFERLLNIPTVLMGFGLPDDGKHGPDEFLHLPTFQRGIQTSVAFMRELGRATA